MNFDIPLSDILQAFQQVSNELDWAFIAAFGGMGFLVLLGMLLNAFEND